MTAARAWRVGGARGERLERRLRSAPGYVLLAVWITILFAPIYLSWLAPSPLSYFAPIGVEDQPVRAGGMMRAVISRCNRLDHDLAYAFTRSLRRLQDGAVTLLPAGSVTVSPGCTTVESRVNLLPDDLPAGTYVLYGVATVTGDLGRTYAIPYTSVPFEVIP